MRSRLLTATPGRFSGLGFPLRFSFQRLRPISHRASACKAVVLPELFGPMKTTGLPSSTSTSPKHLKLRQINFVSISVGATLVVAQRHPLWDCGFSWQGLTDLRDDRGRQTDLRLATEHSFHFGEHDISLELLSISENRDCHTLIGR